MVSVFASRPLALAKLRANAGLMREAGMPSLCSSERSVFSYPPVASKIQMISG